MACGHNEFCFVIASKDYFLTHETFNLLQCTNCGLIRTDPLPDEEAISRYYQSEEYISHSGSEKGIINKLYHLVRKQTLKKKFKTINRYSSGTNILDYGAGSGHFVNYLRVNGYNATGIEPSAGARSNCKQIFNLDLLDTSYIKNIPDNSLDAISMWHVLEHIHEPLGLLSEFKRILKQNGTLFIAVPNIDSFDYKFYDKYWAALDLPRHIHHFSHKSIKFLLESGNLEVFQIKPLLFDSYYISLLSENYRRSKITYLRAPIIGLISNITAYLYNKNYSSCLYISKIKK